MDSDRYLRRIGVDPATVSVDRESLARLQRAHVTTVPFETLSITGHPFDDGEDSEGEGVVLDLNRLYEKVVERERGGFCYELNEPFRWILAELGFAVERRSARVVMEGEPGLPADHLTLVVTLDRRYLVDVGLGAPKVREPVPMDGSVLTDDAGASWRVVESDRPDLDLALQHRWSEKKEWADRFLFRDVDRDLSFFEATCEYHQSAPETPFTGDPVVIVATEDGHARLDPDSLSRTVGGETRERAVAPEKWDAVLERVFGLRYSET